MTTIWIDLETYSSVGLREAGLYAYVESPDHEILMASISVDGRTADRYEGERAILAAIKPWINDPRVTKVAHNAQFERVNLSRLVGLPVGTYLDPDEWYCTMAAASNAGLPRDLDGLAKALGASEKDTAGTRLINTFCKPTRGKRTMPADKPEEWDLFGKYCDQDVLSLIDVHRRMPEMSEAERRFWQIDQRINDRGLKVDLDLARIAVGVDEDLRTVSESRLRDILDINNAGSVPQLTEGLDRLGLALPNLRKETVADTLARGNLTPNQREALELRQEIALVASAKFAAILRSASTDARLRGQYVYYGAHTGRWSSRGVQVQNLPQAQHANPMAAILDLLLGFRTDSLSLKGLVRSALIGPFGIVDYKSIEAMVLAWLAGEEWVLQAFRDERDVYVETAARMSTKDRPLTRKQGKVAVLALGYQGGINSLRHMGAEGDDESLQSQVYRYRDANRKIVRFWRALDEGFRQGGVVGRLYVEREDKTRTIILPSGRRMVYHNVNTGDRITFTEPRGGAAETYGGRLAENVTQGVSRDILANGLDKLERAGYRTVGHTHDEFLVEDADSVSELARIVCDAPKWADGLPLAADGAIVERYRKI